MTIIKTERVLVMAIKARQAGTYKARGYDFGYVNHEGAGPKATVEGDEGQFYMDAVADEHEAVWLMEIVRRTNRELYDEYREQALDDCIDLDESQRVFLTARRCTSERTRA